MAVFRCMPRPEIRLKKRTARNCPVMPYRILPPVTHYPIGLLLLQFVLMIVRIASGDLAYGC